jgi:trehalose/maltose transport system permease protein
LPADSRPSGLTAPATGDAPGATEAAARNQAGARRTARSSGSRRRADRRIGYLLVAPAIIALLAITGFPLVYNLWNSFHTVQLADPAAGHGFSGITNYKELFDEPGFTADLGHTILFTVVSVVFEVVVGLALAVVLNKRFRGRGIVRAAILIPWAVPTVVSAMLWKTMVDPQDGLVNYVLRSLHLPGAGITWSANTWASWAVVVAADAWKTIPLVAIILLAGLQIIPADVYEAAEVDGAGGWRTFWTITLPLLKPALMVALIFRTLGAFLVFDVIYILTGGGPGSSTETLGYLNWKAFIVNSDFGYGGAISVALVVLSLVIAFVYTRLLRPST